MRISDHDIRIRLNQARKFLNKGQWVRIIQRFQGREMAHTELGFERMEDIKQQLSDVGKIQMAPRLNGRQVQMMLVPLHKPEEKA